MGKIGWGEEADTIGSLSGLQIQFVNNNLTFTLNSSSSGSSSGRRI
jgi:hypothetical protein